jgi:signal peptidase I
MAKSKHQRNSGGQAAERAKLQAQSHQRARNIRETIESVAIAFILAFLFRTFEAEAFVIPTGSMAPTLQGQHKDVDCPKCGHRCRIGASRQQSGQIRTQVVVGTCGICGYEMWVGDGPPQEDSPLPAKGPSRGVYNGDRILVCKFSYEFGSPKPWDVVVFKFIGSTSDAPGGGPSEPGLPNYIKRLVGLPGETVTIRYGDIYTHPTSEPRAEPIIRRKSHEKVRAMLQLVHDNEFVPSELVNRNWPNRWQIWPPGSTGGWTTEVETPEGENMRQTFANDGGSADATWIRYQHYVPSWDDWKEIEYGPLPADYAAHPQLITDFYTYNTGLVTAQLRPGFAGGDLAPKLGLEWVGDLALEADVQVLGGQGELLLDLVEAGKHFTCAIDVATGEATLSIDSDPDFAARATTSVVGPGDYSFQWANIDDQLLLWINGEPVEFDSTTEFDARRVFDAPNAMAPVYHSPADPGDLAPAGVGGRGLAAEITGLRIYRDIYYIATTRTNGATSDFTDTMYWTSLDKRLETLQTPSKWGVFATRRSAEFPLEADQFFVLGDNSPFSLDGRLWESEKNVPHYVERKYLIGRALCIYWPHSWDRIPGTPIPLPFFPNFKDMGLVR